ncbi:MAG: 2-phospho-L-lactate guanylyltransferase [Nitrososphaera sp.]|jgi:2-phospho-L-lactate guanylyltransferase
MSRSNIGAIVPVKTFSRAKSRLHLTNEQTELVCKIMLDSVLRTLSLSSAIDKIILVSKDEHALSIGKKFNAIEIYDSAELGVNNAVRLGDEYLSEHGFETSIVFPQDIPFMQSEDIDTLLSMNQGSNSVLVVPSRKFDGTNALLRMPPKIMETHYDEDSYKIHLTTAEKKGLTPALVLIRRIMLDLDDQDDLNFILSNVDSKISKSISSVLNNQ